MDIAEMYVKGKEILKENSCIAVPPVVVSIVTGFFTYHIGKATSPAMFISNPTLICASFLFALVLMILSLLAEGASIAMGYEALKTGKTSLSSGIKKITERVVALILTIILMGLIIGIGFFLLVIPGFIATFFLIFAIPIAVLEDVYAVEALKKSYVLVRNNIGDVFIYVGIAIFIILIGGMAGKVLEAIPFAGKLFLAPTLSGIIMAYIYAVLTIFYSELIKQ